MTKRIAEIFFEIISKEIEKLEKYFLHNIPIITGTVTIKNILIAISKIDIDSPEEESVKIFRDIRTIKGMVKTHSKLMKNHVIYLHNIIFLTRYCKTPTQEKFKLRILSRDLFTAKKVLKSDSNL